MVDALSRARKWLAPDGVVVDIRPAESVPRLELVLSDGSVLFVGEPVVGEERRGRHRNADAALRIALERGLFDVKDPRQFSFFYYADSLPELRDHLATRWRDTHIDDETDARVVAEMSRYPEALLRLHEQVGIRTLVPR